MLIGYARVSTHDQNLDLQKDALEKAGCKKIYIEQMSGSSRIRPELEKTLEILRTGDTLIVWRLDRLGRSLKHLIELITKLEQTGVGFKSLMESMDTTTSGGKLVFHIFGALAEFEHNLIIERTSAGLTAARARGRNGGRPLKLNEKKRELAIKLYNERERSIKEICQIMGISRPTLYTYIHKHDKEAAQQIKVNN
jgi:DNA invertase Pin-like site-specific DNA recombinase